MKSPITLISGFSTLDAAPPAPPSRILSPARIAVSGGAVTCVWIEGAETGAGAYRFTEAMHIIRQKITAGEIGMVYACDLVFHNAYGPDKPWFYDRSLSGGGCLIDLGIHLVDLALWTLDSPPITHVSSTLLAKGRPLTDGEVEDYATATLRLNCDAAVRIACSWNLPAGCDAIISANFYGTKGGLSFHNVNGSFYDFVAEQFHGTARKLLCSPPDAWGGRAAVAWAVQLSRNSGFDPEVAHVIEVAKALDTIYAAGARDILRQHWAAK